MEDSNSSLIEEFLEEFRSSRLLKGVVVVSLVSLVAMSYNSTDHRRVSEQYKLKLQEANVTLEEVVKQSNANEVKLEQRAVELEEVSQQKAELEGKVAELQKTNEELGAQINKSKAEAEKKAKSDAANQTKSEPAPTRSGGRGVSISDNGFKSYMDYRAITNTGSKQYSLQHSGAYTSNGYRMYGGSYMVALGSRFGTVGSKGKVTFSDGSSIPIVIGDIKANGHTDSSNTYHLSDGSVIEFIVDTGSISPMARQMGNMSYCTYVNLSNKVVDITMY